MKKIPIVALLFPVLFYVVSALPLAAQAPSFDTSGNGTLNGNYYFRDVTYSISSSVDSSGIIGNINEGIALFGNIAFDGKGNYTINNGIVMDSNLGAQDPLSCYVANTTCALNAGTPVAGTYSISASGFGFLTNPIVSGDSIYGLVAGNGIFSGSSTETGYSYNDLLIAAPVPSPLPTGFNGSYTVAGYTPGADMFFQLNPNGSGSLGTVNVTGYSEGSGTNTISQSSNATYTFSNGAGVLNFPHIQYGQFLLRPGVCYSSPDGNFFFGGSPVGYDMIVGVSNAPSTQNFGTCTNGTSCLYYQAGIDQNASQLNTGYADFDGYYGSFNATSTGNIIQHARLSDQIFDATTYDWTTAESFTPPGTGTYTDNHEYFQFAVGDGGTVRIGEGIGPYLGLTVAFQAPAFTPTGSVYINPTGIVNAASFAPFTAGVANGEFITIFGTNLAPGTVVASTVPYPTMLNGVQVIVNGVAAPIYLSLPARSPLSCPRRILMRLPISRSSTTASPRTQ